ncbi:thioesterase family protein [Novosphingobium bradum]|uniref:Thioesterase family protein n=1 Tax=Novosphingobium bradum TaxID=1737444 RepID=A0ABV7IJK0_9SPHN
MTEAREPFFRREGDWLVPTSQAKGPWKAGTLHGRVIIGVLAAEIERLHGDPDFLPARLTVDMHRAPAMAPLQVVTRVVRDGARIRVVDAELISEGKNCGRATCQFLRRSANPETERWHGPVWNAALPKVLPPCGAGPETMHGLWEMRWAEGRMAEAGQRRAWMRELRETIGGEPLSPFMRVAAGVDYVSPMANYGPGPGFGFINSDVTMYLHRLPVGEWIGYETLAHEATDGVGIGHCNLYDRDGRIGWASTCALAQSIRANGNPRAG